MFEDTGLITAMANMLTKLLKPLVRLLLKHSFPYSAFEDVAKRVYVEVAMEDSVAAGLRPTVSRAAIVTGLHRKLVTELLAKPWGGIDVDSTHYNRAARVVGAWMRDEELRQDDGRPRPLSLEEFWDLVKRAGDDVPPRAVLEELKRVGTVSESADGQVRLINRGYVPSESMQAKVSILGTDTAELLETIIYNIEHGSGAGLRYQRKVMHTDIPEEVLPAFRELSGKRAQALLEEFDAWLAARDLSGVEEKNRPASARVGVGIYYYEKLSGEGGVKE